MKNQKLIGDLKSLRLKKLLAEFNIDKQYKFCCNNEELARTLKFWNDLEQNRKDACDRLVNTDKSCDVQTARNLLAEPDGGGVVRTAMQRCIPTFFCAVRRSGTAIEAEDLIHRSD